jgi:hypothetical protein
MPLNLYLITAPTQGYEVYSAAVVVAESAEEARSIHPGEALYADGAPEFSDYEWEWQWRRPHEVTATLIGVAAANLSRREVVCVDFHAG